MLTVAGNPCLSAPNNAALERAFASLEFYAAVDFYVNETTRHADVILPPTWSLEHDGYEVLFHGFAVRNTSKYSPVVIAPEPDQRDDWQILSELALRIAENQRTNPVTRTALRWARRFVPGPRRLLDWLLRLGPYGDGFLPWRSGLRLAQIEANPSGIDLGPLTPRLERILSDTGRRLDLAPSPIREELERLRGERASVHDAASGLRLIGRRQPRTNNSWFHNIESSIRGRDRCTLQMSTGDAERLSLTHGQRVRVRSRVGDVTAALEVTDDLMPGVVSLPHGWGHRGPGLRLGVAKRHPGVSCNLLTDDAELEPVVGNAIFNGVPVEVTSDSYC
jgi:anaerobic selenocysteine-containing dehydrogenase